MKHRHRQPTVRVIASMCAALALGVAQTYDGQTISRAETDDRVTRLTLRGVHFVPNEGQWSDETVCYGFRSRGMDIAFRESSLTMHLRREKKESHHGVHGVHGEGLGWALPPSPSGRGAGGEGLFLQSRARQEAACHGPTQKPLPHRRGSECASPEYETLTLTVTFPGSNAVTPRGATPRAAKFNYYIGDDESKWRNYVPSFGAIIYENLYDGIDLHVKGSDDGVLKYEFHCTPGSDYAQIRIRYDGIDSLRVDEKGRSSDRDFLRHTARQRAAGLAGASRNSGGLIPPPPKRSACRRVALETGRAGVGVLRFPPVHGERERARIRSPLPYPPPQSRGRGASAAARQHLPAHFTALDEHTYTIAVATPPDPSRPLIIDPEIEWMYYLGGPGADWGLDLTIDHDSNVLLTGLTESQNFEGRNNSYHGGVQDAFALKTSPSGDLLWMTFLGGSNAEAGRGIVADSADNVFVAGWTNSPDFAGRSNSFHDVRDAFLVRLDASGALQNMFYFGGSDLDEGLSLAVDEFDNALISGLAWSHDFEGRINPHHGGDTDAFVLQVNPSDTLEWMTYIGGSGNEAGSSIAVDANGDGRVVGGTTSLDFEGRTNSHHGGERDAWVAGVSPSGDVQWMTYLGGSNFDRAWAVAVDAVGDAVLTGETLSTDFAGANNTHHGLTDAFVAKVSAAGGTLWATYLGGSNNDGNQSALTIHGISVDHAGNILVTSATQSNDFEGRINSYYGNWDAYLSIVNSSGILQWMMYLGGSGAEGGIDLDIGAGGDAFATGVTESDDFHGRTNDIHGGLEAYLVRVRVPAEVGCADTFTQFRGIPTEGGFADACGSDDVRWAHQPDALAATEVPPIDIEFEGALASDSGSAIRFVVEDLATEDGVELGMSIFNFATNQFEGAVFPNIPTEDTEHVIERTSNVADYIGPNGEVRGRVSYIRPAGVPPFWTIGIDAIRFEVDQ